MLAAPLGAYAVATEPATQPAAASVELAEPAAEHPAGPGKMYTLRGLKGIGPLKNIAIQDGANAAHARGRIDASNLEAILRNAEPLAPDDPLLDEWAYADWCTARFEAGGRRWSASFYLGGLGILMDDEGRRGAFRFTPPASLPPRDGEE